MPTVRPAESPDAGAWLEMRAALWPDGSELEHRDEIERYFSDRFPRHPWRVLLAEADGLILGFAEVSVRPYAEGCRTSRIGYLEGWYVAPGARGRGLGRALVEAAEAWARAQGSTEFASDADPENSGSIAAHRALGFIEAGLVRCFRKDL